MRVILSALPLLCMLFFRRAEMKAKTVVKFRFEDFGNCPELPNLPNGFTEAEIFPIGAYAVGKGVFRFTRPYKRFSKVTVHIKKCIDKADPHCEPFQTWRFGEESCNLLIAKNMLWSPLFNFSPQMACPVKAISHNLENATVDIDRLRLIHFPEKGHYKVSVVADGDNVPSILCYYFAGTFIRIRV